MNRPSVGFTGAAARPVGSVVSVVGESELDEADRHLLETATSE